ncbi:hypothetical protein FRC12_004659 [Ceratobasidium sp. 428]|nr:hypothetical protein FRC12_004659 [Ceratobasidium sp. 428]
MFPEPIPVRAEPMTPRAEYKAMVAKVDKLRQEVYKQQRLIDRVKDMTLAKAEKERRLIRNWDHLCARASGSTSGEASSKEAKRVRFGLRRCRQTGRRGVAGVPRPSEAGLRSASLPVGRRLPTRRVRGRGTAPPRHDRPRRRPLAPPFYAERRSCRLPLPPRLCRPPGSFLASCASTPRRPPPPSLPSLAPRSESLPFPVSYACEKSLTSPTPADSAVLSAACSLCLAPLRLDPLDCLNSKPLDQLAPFQAQIFIFDHPCTAHRRTPGPSTSYTVANTELPSPQPSPIPFRSFLHATCALSPELRRTLDRFDYSPDPLGRSLLSKSRPRCITQSPTRRGRASNIRTRTARARRLGLGLSRASTRMTRWGISTPPPRLRAFAPGYFFARSRRCLTRARQPFFPRQMSENKECKSTYWYSNINDTSVFKVPVGLVRRRFLRPGELRIRELVLVPGAILAHGHHVHASEVASGASASELTSDTSEGVEPRVKIVGTEELELENVEIFRGRGRWNMGVSGRGIVVGGLRGRDRLACCLGADVKAPAESFTKGTLALSDLQNGLHVHCA